MNSDFELIIFAALGTPVIIALYAGLALLREALAIL